MAMKIFATCLCFMLCLGASHAETRDAQEHFFNMTVGDLKGELAAAKDEGKVGIMVMYEMEDCPFCYRMRHTILNQSEVQEYYRKNFLIFTVDIRGDIPLEDFNGKATTEKAFSLEHRVYGTPVFDFFDLNGELITRFPGTAKDVNEFLLLGRCVIEGACKDSSFTVYKRQQAK